MFFDPWFALFKKKVGDTIYGIGWLPLGGYVKISGMIDESMDKDQLALPPQPWEFRSKPAWQRWLAHQTMLINENRLSPLNPQHRAMLEGEMLKFLFGGGAEKPAGYVPADS